MTERNLARFDVGQVEHSIKNGNSRSCKIISRAEARKEEFPWKKPWASAWPPARTPGWGPGRRGCRSSGGYHLSGEGDVGPGGCDPRNIVLAARRELGLFDSLFQFCEHIDLRLLNKRVIESLIKAGAFDSLKCRRSQLMEALDVTLEQAKAVQRDRLSGQIEN